MRPGASALLLGNLLLAGGIAMLGWPSSLAVFHRLPVEAMVSDVRAGHLPDAAEFDDLTAHLSAAAQTSPAARNDLAFALLLDAGRQGEDAATRTARIDQAVTDFSDYLREVPGDALAWAGLVDALMARDRRLDAMHALKMSMITAPRSPSLLLWRCRVGLDLFYILDAEGRDLLEQQFREATEKEPAAVVTLATKRNAVPIVRSLLQDSPAALGSFDERLAQLRS